MRDALRRRSLGQHRAADARLRLAERLWPEVEARLAARRSLRPGVGELLESAAHLLEAGADAGLLPGGGEASPDPRAPIRALRPCRDLGDPDAHAA